MKWAARLKVVPFLLELRNVLTYDLYDVSPVNDLFNGSFVYHRYLCCNYRTRMTVACCSM